MDVASWNVNSLKAREGRVLDWLEAHPVDALCLQETKCTDQEFPEDGFGDLDYEAVFTGEKSYNGVAILSQEELTEVSCGLGDGVEDEQARLITGQLDGLRLVNIYLPNGQDLDSPKYPYKLAWMERLRAFLDRLDPTLPLVLCGDFNVLPSALDSWDSARRGEGIFASAPERARYQALLDWGLTDAYRLLHPEGAQYTWWDYRGAAFGNNRGMRIDHLLVTAPLVERVQAVTVHEAERAKDSPSDHVPVVLSLAD